jgi:RND family efflux transporter MFP subunit
MKTPRIHFGFLLLLPLFAALTACSKPVAPATQPELVRGVALLRASAQTLPATVDAVGTVRPAISATLSPQVMGVITSVAVHEGDRVHSGEVLVTIDSTELSSQLERAHAATVAMQQQSAAAATDAALAASTLKRYQMLKDEKSVSPQEFDEVQSRAQSAEARLSMAHSQEAESKAAEATARTMRGYARILAPFDGVVTERKVDPGALAAPGSPLLTVEKSGLLRLEVSVDESLLSSLRAGGEVPVVIDSLGATPIQGKIAEISPAADAASRSFLVKINLPAAAGLHSGIFGHAILPQGTRQAVLIPRAAIVARGSMQSVYVVGPDQIAVVRYITTGDAHGAQVEVLSGLSAGETLAASPGERELSGKRIEAEP